MKNASLERRIKAAIATSGFGENGPEKQETRRLLIEAGNRELDHPPFNIFTLMGMEGYCAKNFRDTWPTARIVGLDRHHPPSRLSKAHWYGRETAIGMIENDIIHGSLRDYAKRNKQRLWRRMRNGKKDRLLTFDFPLFDLLFLDTTAYPSDSKDSVFHHTIEMINEHCTSPAIVGLTFVIGKRDDEAAGADDIITTFRSSLTRVSRLIGEPFYYVTNSSMLFFVLKIE